MRRRRNEIEEPRIQRALARLWRGIPTPSEEELQEIARSARAESREAQGTLVSSTSRPRRRIRVRWAVAAAAVALLLGSGLGFGLGSSLTPSGSAGGNFVGFGFLPAQGWNVMQSGTLDDAGEARATAANVPLDPRDDLGGAPLATLESLPTRGVLILATFSPRGDPAKDNDYPVRESPLRLGDAERLTLTNDLARYRLRAGIGGYNVDARVYFGEDAPSTRALAIAQGQLGRLAVAAERVTLRARPSIVSTGTRVTLFGSVDSGRAGEALKIQAKDCGLDFFRVVDGAVTEAGGGWSRFYWLPGPSTTLRAVWNDATSTQVTVQKRAYVHLQRRLARRFEVRVGGKLVWRKRVLFQRFDRRLGTWQAVKSAVLTESLGTAHGGESVAAATVTLSLPKGTRVRAVFPRTQTGPCYLAGTSNTLRTG